MRVRRRRGGGGCACGEGILASHNRLQDAINAAPMKRSGLNLTKDRENDYAKEKCRGPHPVSPSAWFDVV